MINENDNNEEKVEVENNNEIEIEKNEIYKGVTLIKEYKSISDNINYPNIEGIYTFKVQLNTMNILYFDLYLDNSENILLENDNLNDSTKSKNNFHIKTIINPYETKVISKIVLKNNWRLKTKFKISLKIPSKSIQYQYIEKDEQKIQKNLQNFTSYYNTMPTSFEFMNQNNINKIFKELNIKFIDVDFPPCDESFINDKDKNNLNLDYAIHWRRPEEFINNDILESLTENNNILRVFQRGKEPQPNDIKQGLLFFSLLDSCISALSEKYNLIKRLFITNIYNEYGIYKVKLCYNGQWKTVVIDDYFPCIPNSLPIVTRAPGNELWVLILQKALAKLYGCYYNLSFLTITDFFLSLTGCPSVLINLKENININNDMNEENDIFNSIKNFVIDKKYIVVAISKISEYINNNGDNDNLESRLTIPNYGYSIIDIKDKFSPGIIILRKVWYNEKIEKNIDNYTNQILNQYPSLLNELNDNSLILTYDKFLSEFNSVVICFTKNWDEVRLRGKFITNNNKEDEHNYILPMSKWYYSMNLSKPTNVIISLLQDVNTCDSNNLTDISLSLLKKKKKKNEINLIKTYDLNISSNIQIELYLIPGDYIIYPRTSGCFMNSNILSDKDNITESNNKAIIYNLESKKFSNKFLYTVKEIFKKYDIYLNNYLSYEEFNNFYKCIKNISLSEKDYNINISSKYQSFDKSITEKEFIDFFRYNYLENGEKEIKTWLYNLGYSENLNSLKEKSFIITFHSDNEIKVKISDAILTNLQNKIERVNLKYNGEIIKKKRNIMVIRYQSGNTQFFSYGVLNNDIIPLRIVLSFKEYDNIILCENLSHIEKIVQPGKYELFTHLFYINNNDDNNINKGINFDFDVEYYLVN